MVPLFLNVSGRRIVLVGRGPVAESKQRQFAAEGADVRTIDPDQFQASHLDDAWLVVAAASLEINRDVARAAEARRIFVNAVDDPANATAYLSGIVRRDGVTIAISTEGAAPALTALLREALDEVLPHDLEQWVDTARDARNAWKRSSVPMEQRKPLLLAALNRLYQEAPCV